VHLAFAGARYFERLADALLDPEELFGPLSLRRSRTTATSA